MGSEVEHREVEHEGQKCAASQPEAAVDREFTAFVAKKQQTKTETTAATWKVIWPHPTAVVEHPQELEPPHELEMH